MPDNLPARRVEKTRFPETKTNNDVIYANVSDDRPPPRTQYVRLEGEDQGRRTISWTGGPLKKYPVPRGVPNWLGSQKIIGYAWVISMGLVSYDEWTTHNILPRPSRLWWTSLVFLGLMVVGLIPAAVPLANAFAIGYTLKLAWDLFNKQGQFG